MAEQAAKNDMVTKSVVEATRAAIQKMVELHQGQEDQRPKVGSLVLKQPQINWATSDKYMEWKAFVLEVRNVIPTYNARGQEKIAMVKNWLDRKGLHYIESLTEVEKQACSTLQGLIDTLAKIFWPQYNETIKSPQFRQLCRHEVPLRPWEAVGADIFHLNNINYLCVVDYNSKFPIIRKLQGLSLEYLINAVSATFAKYCIQ